MEKLDPPLYELKTRYVEFAIQESSNLAKFDFEYMRERVTNTEEAFEKNMKCAKEMDGNVSDDNEEYVIQTMKSEVPEIMKQLKNIRKDTKSIEDSIKQIQKKKDIKKINAVKLKIKDTDGRIFEFEQKAK